MALFFVSSTDARRALAEAARQKIAGRSWGDLLEREDFEDNDERPTFDEREAAEEEEVSLFAFSSAEILTEMRRAADQKTAAAAAARRCGKTSATEVPCVVPSSLSELEFRLLESRGRAAYNKLFEHNQGLVYYEVNKVWPNWQRATVMEKADFLQEGAQGLLRAIRLFDSVTLTLRRTLWTLCL